MGLTKSELKIMKILWLANRPLSRDEILTLNPDQTWSGSSLHGLLNSLMDKGAVCEAGFKRNGNTWGRLYRACLTYSSFCLDTLAEADGHMDYLLFFRLLIDLVGNDIQIIKEIEKSVKKTINKS